VTRVDVVIVSFNSRSTLRACVAPLARDPRLAVIVVDNASEDDCLTTIEDLPVKKLTENENRGFAHGCNVGWRAGASPYVAFLNPDARTEPGALIQLVGELEQDPDAGAVGPKILHEDGSLERTQHRFPRLLSSFARGLFLHRLLPGAQWTTHDLLAAASYERRGSPDWVGGACMILPRALLERVGGFDDGFFMYCEDMDLCRRIRDEGFLVRFVPEVIVTHGGGASTPTGAMVPVHAASRLRYARKHRSRLGSAIERAALALHAFTHMLVARGGIRVRAGHARALRQLVIESRSGGH
jgi:GT2 family glycosyltransferase